MDKIFSNPTAPIHAKVCSPVVPQLDSPFRLLPTVTDYMEATTKTFDGHFDIHEKEVDEQRAQGDSNESGRGRLLHPKNELRAKWGTRSTPREVATDTTSVKEGTEPLLGSG